MTGLLPQGHQSVVVGVDLGGTNMSIGVVTDDGRIIGSCKRKTKPRTGASGVLDRVVEGIRRAVEEAGVEEGSVAAVGIGVPSAVDIPRGVAIRSVNLGWNQVPVRELLATRLNLPVAVDNDVNAAAWGEATLGAGRGATHLLAVWVGTGVGGAIVLGGRLFHGSFWTAGEVGQTIVAAEAGPGRSTLEEICGRAAMVTALRRILPGQANSALHRLLVERDEDDPRETIGSSTIAEAYGRRDELTVRVVDHAADVLGMAIANWITVLAIDTVILGGGVVEALGDAYVSRVRRSFERHVFPAESRRCELRSSELGDHAGVLGAAMMARAAIVEQQGAGEIRGGLHAERS